MLSSYTNPETIVYKKKEETSKTTRKDNNIIQPNNSFVDDENERIRKGLMSTIEAIKNVDREFEEKMKKRRKETMIYFLKSIVY